ncbi:MAG: PEGA domain-containing protein [Bryobacterales bacterium]|nr:PEGA domain-containing protein [Bryobacterales bacterium]
MRRYGLFLLCAAVLITPALAQTGYLKTKVNPGRAGVFIDGKYVGPAANFRIGRKYAVAPGQHEVKLVEPRYEDVTSNVTIEAGKTFTLRETMKPRPLAQPPFGRLRIKHTDKFAAVYLNDKYFGHVDEFSNFAQGVLLNPGTYDVRVEPTGGGQPISQKVTIEADRVSVVQ